MKKMVMFIGIVIGLYIAFCATVYYYPQYFFYNPDKQASDSARAIEKYGYNIKEVKFRAADGTELSGWYVPQKGSKKVIAFMHGNSYNVEKFYKKLVPLLDAGYSIFAGEYRGFGGVKGKITQAGLEQDAIAAVEYLYQQGWKNNQIIIYGMSLGSHMAVNTAEKLQKNGTFAAVVLEVPFDSLLNVVKEVVFVPLPLEIIIKDKYDNVAAIKEIKSPILIMGGEKDTVVPVTLAKRLYAEAPEPKDIIIYEEGGHNDLYDLKNYNELIEWLKNK